MYKDYISINGRTIASDAKGMHEMETHDRIKEELTLENEIEELNSAISLLEKDKSKLGTLKKNKRERIISYIKGIALIIFIVFLCKGIHKFLGIPDIETPGARFSFIHTDSDALLFVMLPVGLLLSIPYIFIEPHKSRKRDEEILTIEEQLEYLNSELEKKKEQLEALRKNITKKDVVEDTKIHSLDISNYRSLLASRLTLLESIRKYRKDYQKALEDGTLREELTEMGVEPENIVFVKEVLKRTLEKKDN